MALPDVPREVVAIVPAYNEAERIDAVLRVLLDYGKFSEILVIDDGSTDGTAAVAEGLSVRVLRNEINLGKGLSMERAVRETEAPVIFFADADVRGLSPAIVGAIVEPVAHGRVDMFIGMRNRKIYFAKFIFSFIPLLGGERALARTLWEQVPEQFKEGFQIESALNFFASRDGRVFDFQVFPGLTQTIKEKKYGFRRGFVWRITMFREIIVANFRLHSAAWSLSFRKLIGMAE